MAIAKRKRTKKHHVVHLARNKLCDKGRHDLYSVAISFQRNSRIYYDPGTMEWVGSNMGDVPIVVCPEWFNEIAETPKGKPYRLSPGAKPRPVRLRLIVEEVK